MFFVKSVQGHTHSVLLDRDKDTKRERQNKMSLSFFLEKFFFHLFCLHLYHLQAQITCQLSPPPYIKIDKKASKHSLLYSNIMYKPPQERKRANNDICNICAPEREKERNERLRGNRDEKQASQRTSSTSTKTKMRVETPNSSKVTTICQQRDYDYNFFRNFVSG